MASKKQTFKIHELSIDDALDLGGILAAGGLTGQASRALSQMQLSEDGKLEEGAAVSAIAQLVMGALANRSTRDEMRGFLFGIWRTTEDDEALEDDLDIAGRLKPQFENGEPKKGTLYYRKLKRFHTLPPKALVELSKAVYRSDGFADFLELLKMELPTASTELPTDSNGTTDSHPVK